MRLMMTILLLFIFVSETQCSRTKKKPKIKKSFELYDSDEPIDDNTEEKKKDEKEKKETLECRGGRKKTYSGKRARYSQINFKCKARDVASLDGVSDTRNDTPIPIYKYYLRNYNMPSNTQNYDIPSSTPSYNTPNSAQSYSNAGGNSKSNCNCTCKCGSHGHSGNDFKAKHVHNRNRNNDNSESASRMNMGSFEIIDAEYDSVPANQVKIVFVVFAHGEIIPDPEELKKYAPKELFEDFETGLSDLGKNESYHVGSYLRSRYKNYLSDVYVQSEIRIRSLDVDFIKSSMIMALAGLYPPLPSGETMLGTPNMQPVPYDSIPLEDDDLVPYENCPTFKLMRKQTTVIRKVQMKLKPIKKSLTEERYFRVGTKTDFDIYKAMDAWKVLRFLCPCNMEAAKIASFRSTALAIREAAKYSFWTQLFNQTLIRFAAGVMMNEVVKAIDLIENNIPTVKMYLVAGSDFQVAAWMAASKVFALHQPDYGAVFGLEIYRIDKYDDYGVRALYKPKSDRAESILLKIKDCRGKNGYCSTREFKRAVKKYLMSDVDYKKECKLFNRRQRKPERSEEKSGYA